MDALTLPLDSPQCNAVTSLADFSEPTPEQIGTGIPELFAAALSHNLKLPKMQLVTAAGFAVILKLAGSRSKWPGSVHVAVEADYHEFTYCGSISTSGVLYPKAAMKDDVHTLLVRMTADPVTTALEQAKITGRCVFCWKQLTDPRSVCHGHGKRCAEVWGLRWDAPRSYRGLFGDVWSAVSGAELVGA